MNSKLELELKETFAEAAQTVYNHWEQDEDGLDPDIGSGGICSLIVDEAIHYFQESGYDAWATGTDEHAWVIVNVMDELLEVDIPYSTYEIGAGYNWTKIPGVEFTQEDVCVWVSEEEIDTVLECAHLM